MPIDSRNKRAAALGFLKRKIPPLPDSDIDKFDRAQMSRRYFFLSAILIIPVKIFKASLKTFVFRAFPRMFTFKAR
jgi:hypothetical protein